MSKSDKNKLATQWLSPSPPKISLVSELRWYIAYLRIFGAFPVIIQGDILKPSNSLRALNIVAAVSLLFFALSIKHDTTDHKVLAFVVEGIGLSSMLGVVFGWIGLARKTKILCRIFQSLQTVDSLLTTHGVQPNLRNHATAAWLWTGLFHAKSIVDLVLEYFYPLWILSGLLRYVVIEIYFTLLFMLMSSMSFLMLITWHRFELINEKLKAVAEQAERNQSILVLTEKIHIHPIKSKFFLHQTCADLQKCHLLTSRACNDIMDIYGLACVFALIYATGELGGNIYNTFAPPLVHSNPLTFKLVFNSIKWAMLSILRFLSIVVPFSYVAQTANETYDLVFELQVQVSDPEVKRQLDSFSFQLNRPLEFRPFTLFALDMNLFLTMLGCVATYVVILLQLHAAAPDIPTYV